MSLEKTYLPFIVLLNIKRKLIPEVTLLLDVYDEEKKGLKFFIFFFVCTRRHMRFFYLTYQYLIVMNQINYNI